MDLRPLKPYLQRCDIAECAFETGISVQQASNVMSGRSVNWDFAHRIMQRAERNKALKEKVKSI